REPGSGGDEPGEGQAPCAPLCKPPARGPIVGAEGKPLLVELSTLQEVSAGRSLRLALRPLIDAFSGQSDLANPDPATRRGAVTKMGNTGDLGALPVLETALGSERDRWVRFALQEAMALIHLRAATPAQPVPSPAHLPPLP